MRQVATSASFGILHRFQEFYIEIDELRRAASLRKPLAGTPGAIEKLPEAGFAAETRRKAAALLERHYLDTLHAGTLASGLYREARFVMAAFADEVFVRLDWDGAAYWRSHLLEAEYFRTQSAGEIFFRNIQQLLIDDDSTKDELRILYLTALALGFRGPESEATVAGLRKDLYERITLRPQNLRTDTEHLFPEAYLSTITGGVVRRMPSPTQWWTFAAGVVLVWLLFSTVIWNNVSHEVRTVLDSGSATPEKKAE